MVVSCTGAISERVGMSSMMSLPYISFLEVLASIFAERDKLISGFDVVFSPFCDILLLEESLMLGKSSLSFKVVPFFRISFQNCFYLNNSPDYLSHIR